MKTKKFHALFMCILHWNYNNIFLIKTDVPMG